MKRLSRREFLAAGTMGLVTASQLRGVALGSPRIDAPISFQSWGMKDQLSEDFDGTLEEVRAIGYAGMEMCSPISYGQFEFLRSLSGSELRQRIESAGLFCRTCHFSSGELLGDAVPGTIEYGKELGLVNLTMSSAGIGRDATLDDWKAFAEGANASGEQVRAAGLQLVYHNHAIGPEYDGVPLYDHLMQLFEPELVMMQFQLASISGGYDIVEYLDKYAGRYVSLHMHDWDPEARTIVPIGDGIIDWPRLLTTARKSDIADFGLIVEIETEEPLEGLVRSYAYLSELEV
jgi:sugar phosphate isomerase/epimerase